jgi:hypothetical protein
VRVELSDRNYKRQGGTGYFGGDFRKNYRRTAQKKPRSLLSNRNKENKASRAVHE